MIGKKLILFLTLPAILFAMCGCSRNSEKNDPAENIIEISQLSGLKVGIQTGSTFDIIADEYIENAQKQYFETYADMAIAVTQGKISAFLIDEPMARVLCNEQKGVRYLEEFLCEDEYAFAFAKTDKGAALRDQMNEFLAEIHANGVLKEIEDKWFGIDESVKNISYPDSVGSSGTLRFVFDSSTPPFSYVKDGAVIGYDIDILCRFCKKYDYGLEMSDANFASIIPALVSGKADLSACCISVTEERAQSVYFSEANYDGGVVVMVADKSGTGEEQSFFGKLKDSFYKNFIKENRWKLLLSGLGVTAVISVSAGIFGAVLGFGICMLRRSQNQFLSGMSLIYIQIVQGMPILVFLMILFYVVFGQTDISPVIVAIIGFSVNFSAYVSEMMRTGIESVDKGQNEAALALGYTKRQSFFKVVFPQAAIHFLPVIKGEFVSLVKMTSIVGYIMIQDLTKASDIIRSRTYEAFFPLIVTAIIYFAVSWLITVALGRIEIRLDPKKRGKNRKGQVKEVDL
ncbi:MAG: ABC transporter substrate-binding protein/permease [Bacteroides sp.]|nr:ABC transporter substrate-binding protein/permease [Ruminococcus sp.]MCM1463716.1 ABC transporter substrate-binding protein/permease [Bacteroides sp.]